MRITLCGSTPNSVSTRHRSSAFPAGHGFSQLRRIAQHLYRVSMCSPRGIHSYRGVMSAGTLAGRSVSLQIPHGAPTANGQGS